MQCCMISIDDNEQEIDEVTLLSGQHLSLPQKEKLSQNEKDDASKGKVGNSSQPLSPRLSVSCLACIMFSDEDLQLRKKISELDLICPGHNWRCMVIKNPIGLRINDKSSPL